MQIHAGSCLCGAVKYEVRGEFDNLYYCYCSRCRKTSESAFTSNAVMKNSMQARSGPGPCGTPI